MHLYQSFLGDEQRSFVSPKAIPLDVKNNTGTDQREYELLKRIWIEQLDGDEPWGLISWKFQNKSVVSVDEFIDFGNKKLASGFDCAFINPMIGSEALYHSVWEQGIDCGHTGLDKIFTFLREGACPQVAALMGSESFAFCNYFVATARFWDEYFSFVDRALSSLESEIIKRSEVGKIYAGSANYARDASVTMRPFVIERLFSSFVVRNSSMRCAGFPYRDAHYRLKFGTQLGNFLCALSNLKNSALKLKDQKILQYWNGVRENILKSTFKLAVYQLDDPLPFFLSRECADFMRSEGFLDPDSLSETALC